MSGAASCGMPARAVAVAVAALSLPVPRCRSHRAAGVVLVVAALAAAPWTAARAVPSPSSRAAALVRAGGNADRAAVEAARRFLCPHGGAPARGGRCRASGVLAASGRDPSMRDWDAGLPAAARKQAPCPEGTIQARPMFWSDAVRCVPR